jgi:beta-lactamase class D
LEVGRRLRSLKDWEQDLELDGALRVSCVPCFQDVARRIGEGRMRKYLHGFRYGNEDISGPIDRLWLDGGPLRITPRGQTEFLHRMLSGELPVKKANVGLLWRLLEIEHGPDFTCRGKTGLGSLDGRAIGWLTGYVERDGRRWIYATFVQSRAGANVEAETTRLVPLRKSITRALLVKAHVLPGE